MSEFENYVDDINEFIKSDQDVMYLDQLSREERKEIHEYVEKNFSKKYVSRSEYEATGTERLCCGTWYKSSEYGKSWNGGYIFCDICNNITGTDYDDYEDVMNNKDIRVSNYRPTGEIMICKKGYPYKRSYGCPFSYRKHY